jgi:hypothetical protein
MRKGLYFGLLAALSVAGPAMAEEGFNYSYVDLGYVKSELDDYNVEGDGFGLRGSYEFTKNVHAFAGYTDQEYDFGVNATTMELGAGYAWPVNSNMDLIGSASYVHAEVKAPGFGSADDSGLGLGVGVRGRVVNALELTGGLQYVDFDKSGNDTTFTAGGRYYFTNRFAAGLDMAFDDAGTTWMLGGRFSFGQ